MSMWTDRELKALIRRVDALEARVAFIAPPEYVDVGHCTKGDTLKQEPPDKRTKEWREWKHANS